MPCVKVKCVGVLQERTTGCREFAPILLSTGKARLDARQAGTLAEQWSPGAHGLILRTRDGDLTWQERLFRIQPSRQRDGPALPGQPPVPRVAHEVPLPWLWWRRKMAGGPRGALGLALEAEGGAWLRNAGVLLRLGT